MARHSRAQEGESAAPTSRGETNAARTYLNIQEFARFSGLSVSTVRRLVEAGNIPFYQPGGKGTKVLLRRDALELTHAKSDLPGLSQDPEAAKTPRGPKPRWMRPR